MKNRLNFSPKQRETPKKLIALWAVNGLLLVALLGLSTFWLTLRQRNVSAHSQLANLKEQQRRIVTEHQSLLVSLKAIDMPLHRKSVLLYHQIQEVYQTQWSRLLDDLGQALPEDVRIVELRPAASATRAKDRETVLTLRGEARGKTAQLAFIQELQSLKPFSQVRFESEDYSQTGVAVVFQISFVYRVLGDT